MTIKKFYAIRSREALNMVRAEFGSDANIISSRLVNGWNEIIASRQENDEMFDSRKTDKEAVASKNIASHEFKMIMQEIQNMRQEFKSQILELQMGSVQHNVSVKKNLLHNMFEAGFGTRLSHYLIDNIPLGLSDSDAQDWAIKILGDNLNIAADESEILDTGGIFALMGTHGAGKTTAVVCIADRFIQRHGIKNLALISLHTDHTILNKQLKVEAAHLGVIHHYASDAAGLKKILATLNDKHTVLIDTAGLNQTQESIFHMISLFKNTELCIKKILCLDATHLIEEFEATEKLFRQIEFIGCLITKTDQTDKFGAAINIALQLKLKVLYLTTLSAGAHTVKIVDKEFLFCKTFNKFDRQRIRAVPPDCTRSNDIEQDPSACSFAISEQQRS